VVRQETRWYLQTGKKEENLSVLAHDPGVEFSTLLASMVKAGVGRKRNRKKE